MEPIISPWILYWVSVLCNVNYVLSVVNGLSIAIIVMIGGIRLVDYINHENGDDMVIMPNWFKYLKICLIVVCISSLLCIFIPDKQTMISMIAVSYITPDNINITTDYVIELVQRISEAVKEVE